MSNIEIITENMSSKQFTNLGRLLVKAENLGWFDHGRYTPMIKVSYNNAYGNTFIWSEDYSYSLFINDSDNTIKALYSCPYDGEETFINASTAEKLEAWSNRQSVKTEKKENN